MGTLFVDKLDPQSGTSLEIGSSGDTMTVPSGATLNVAGTLQSGGAAIVNTPIIQVYLSGNQTLTNGQFDKITFDSETYDTGSNFASNKFTVAIAGYYYIELKVDFDYGTEVPNDKKCKIQKNGSTNLSEGFMNGDGHPYGTVTTSTIANLAVNDYIEGYAYVQSGTASFAKSGSAYTQMKIMKLIT